MNTKSIDKWTPKKLLGTSLAYWNACSLHAALRLDVFSKLYEQSLATAQLAKQCACDARGMELLVTALVSMELLEKTNEQSIVLTPIARQCLCRQSEKYMGFILLHGADNVPAWQLLHEAVQNGQPTCQNFVPKHTDEEREHFLLGMHNFAGSQAGEVSKKICLQGKKHLLDLGGATGTYAMHFCEQNPELKVTLFDLPTSETLAKKIISENNMQDRIHFIGGNFIQDDLPIGCDVAWISHILHCFGPEQCRIILKRAWESLPSGAMIYIQEFILDDAYDGSEFIGLFGLNMLATTEGGQTYSFKDMSEMLQELGAVNITRLHLNLSSDADIIQAQKP